MIAAACSGLVPIARARLEAPLAVGGAAPPRWLSAFGIDLAGSDENGASATVFYGWLDNRAELAAVLGLDPATDPAATYEAAVQRWGAGADSRIIGSYCAITALPGGRMRLVRSPWTAPPLHYVCNAERRVVSSVLRVIFNAGHPREVDHDYLIDQLLQDHHDGEPRGWYVGIGRVPLGCTVELGPDGARLERYYDPCAVSPVRFAQDDDYRDAATALLDRSAAAALAQCKRPGLMLSGGLDSPLVAAAVLRQLPAGQNLPSFTFGPLPEWDGRIADYWFGDEREFVRAFAALHPRLEPHFPSSAGHDFDYRLRELLALTDTPTANVANVGIMHGAWEAAKAAGCDCMLTADLGNFTFSNAAPWYPVEWLRQGRWGDLLAALRGHPADYRPLWRKVLAHAVLPLLPAQLRNRVHELANPGMGDRVSLISLVCPAERQRHDARRSASSQKADFRAPRSRQEWIMRAWHSADSGEDLDLGFERLHGLRRRDVSASRPLIEFCLGLPTDQYVQGSEHRRLALRMAEGLMPEAQRCNPRYGMHHADWHLRLGRRRAELTAYAGRMRDHPALAKVIDIDRFEALLADWPEEAPTDPVTALPRWIGITRAVTAATFVGYAEGRNDL